MSSGRLAKQVLDAGQVEEQSKPKQVKLHFPTKIPEGFKD